MLSAPLLSSLSEFLAAQIGLHFPRERWNDLERGMVAAARELGNQGVEAYVRKLLAEPVEHRQIAFLASHLTVGETYFFRDGNSFAALEQSVFPELIRSRRGSDRRLRIWSAGCCTGEEPYSIAMLLDRMLPEHEQWHISILATDINPQFLQKAEQGEYGEWSFRETPAWIKERYFKSNSQGRFEIHPRIKKMVTFSYLNLADDAYPSLANNTNAMDLILCRNVLMYLTAEHAARIAGHLYCALANEGWLLTSPAEASNSLFSQFEPVYHSGTPFFRKTADSLSHPVEVTLFAQSEHLAPAFFMSSGGVPDAKDSPVFMPIPTAPSPEMESQKSPLLQPADAAEPLCISARRCANQGNLTEAADWCKQAIAADKLNPLSHYLLASIRQELGQTDAAEQSLKRALYLDPDFVLAYFTLGNLRLSQGRQAEAGRCFENALGLLRQRPLEEIIAESDGLTVGRLNEIIQSVLDSQPSAYAMRERKGARYA